MAINLSKGQKLSLSKEVNGLSSVVAGLGWDAAKRGLFSSIYKIDCDASALTFDSKGTFQGIAYYGNKTEANGCVKHHGDNLTGEGDGDDEQITVDLKNMPSNISKVVFAVNIYDCVSRKQDFGMVNNAFIRLVDKTTNKEICRYNLSDKYSGKTAMIFAEVYKEDNEWKVRAIGEGNKATSITNLIRMYR